MMATNDHDETTSEDDDDDETQSTTTKKRVEMSRVALPRQTWPSGLRGEHGQSSASASAAMASVGRFSPHRGTEPSVGGQREDPQLRDALGPQLPPVHRAAPQRCLSGQSDRAVCLASGLCLSACVSLSARQSPLAPAVLHENAPRFCHAIAGGQSPKPEP